jgi:hypothetical protein
MKRLSRTQKTTLVKQTTRFYSIQTKSRLRLEKRALGAVHALTPSQA